ncbi:hypothetical protein Tco_0658723 [Tanacetum coccineum]
MSTHEQHTPTVPTSAVRNTGRRSGPQGLKEPMPDEVLRELHAYSTATRPKKNQRNHEESHYSESKTPTVRTEPKRRHGNRRSRSPSPVASVFKRLKKTNLLHLGLGRGRRVVCSIGWKEKNEAHLHVLTAAIRVPTKRKPRCNQGSIIIGVRRPGKLADIRRVKTVREVTRSQNQEDTGQTPTKMISLSLGHVRKETLSHLAVAKTERWAMPTWCHMFNSTLTGIARVWFDKLPRESIDNYEDLRTAFRENYL